MRKGQKIKEKTKDKSVSFKAYTEEITALEKIAIERDITLSKLLSYMVSDYVQRYRKETLWKLLLLLYYYYLLP